MISKLTQVLTFLSLILSGMALALVIKPELIRSPQTAPAHTSDVTTSTPVLSPIQSPQTSDLDKTVLALNEQLVRIANKVMPTVVTVFIEKVWKQRVFDPFSGFDSFFDDFFFGRPRRAPRQPQEQEFRSQGLGSGVILTKDGYILTNNHVVAEATTISVNLLDKRIRKARVVGKDPKTDLAVIKIDEVDLPFLTQGDSSRLRVGEIVLAVGSPMSPGLAHTVTQGIVSAIGRSNVGVAEYEDFIQTDAAINPGNSGGALVNIHGELVGINSAIVSQSGGSQGIGFAIPVNMAKIVMNALIKTGKVSRGWMGIATQDIGEDLARAMNLKVQSGVIVSDLNPNGPAALAGILRGDILVKANGDPIETSGQFRNRIAETGPGEKLKIEILRKNQSLTREVILKELPQSQPEGETPRGKN